jgi:16S rRNA (adenine1518-N6/adenine1519-N6)-dimethyltransferase
MRQSLASWAGSPAEAEAALVAAGISPQARGEELTIEQFVSIARARG